MKKTAFVLSSLAVVPAFANFVTPALDDVSGKYTFGSSGYAHSTSPESAAQLNAMDYPVWANVTAENPAFACTGSAVLYAPPPAGSAVDWSQHGSIMLLGNGIIPSTETLTFTSGQYLYCWYQTALPANDGTAFTANAVKNAGGVIDFTVNLDGGNLYLNNGRAVTVSGGLTGTKTGSSVLFAAYSSALALTGKLDFAGSISCASSQYGEYIDLRPSEMTDRKLWCIDVGCSGNASNTPQYLRFNPAVAGSTLYLRTLRAAQGSALLNESATYYRQGGNVLVYNGNTIETEYLNSGMHIYASDKMLKTKATKPTAGLGIGNIVVTTECKPATGQSMYLGTNINFRAAKVTNAINFDFTAQEDGVNGRTVEITGSCNAGCTAKATSPAMLPRVLKGFAGTIDLTVTGARTDWSFPFDFAAGEPCPSACAGSGALTVPASGTIAVTLANGDKATRGTYPLMTATSGGAALSAAAWPVSINGTVAESLTVDEVVYTVVRDDTGVALRIEPIEGLGIAVE